MRLSRRNIATQGNVMGETKKSDHRWRRVASLGALTNYGWAVPSGTYYHCLDCLHYARTDSVPGPCPPPEDSPKLLESN